MGKRQSCFMIQRFGEVCFMSCCCYLQNAVRARVLWCSAHFHYECLVALHFLGDALSLEIQHPTLVSIGFEILEKGKEGWRQLKVPAFKCIHLICC